MNGDNTERDEHRIWRAEDHRTNGGEYPTTRGGNFTWDTDELSRDTWMAGAW